MVLWHLNKKYISVDELARIFSKDYGVKVTENDVYRLCYHYHLKPFFCKRDNYTHKWVKCDKSEKVITMFGENNVKDMRTKKGDFSHTLDMIINPMKFIPDLDKEPQCDFIPDESRMEFVNQQLLDLYQTESRNRKVINITENQFKNLFSKYDT